jgi:hypothetical protein
MISDEELINEFIDYYLFNAIYIGHKYYKEDEIKDLWEQGL